MAVLAAASEYGLHEAASAMVTVSRVLEPRRTVAGRFVEPYLRFVDELYARRWSGPPLVDRARRRALP